MGTAHGAHDSVYSAEVSIQLMSPASGDNAKDDLEYNAKKGFHSINVPSEWGQVQPEVQPEIQPETFPFN